MEQSNDRADKKYIKGELLYTIFHNEAEHFSIAKIKIHDTNEDYKEDEIVGKGYFSNLQEGTVYSFYGEMEKHPKFGWQYSIISYETYIPNSKDGLVSYLSSDLFYGVGEKTAMKIIEHLGEDAIAQILSTPTIVEEIPGLGKDTGKLLAETLQENQGFEHVVVYLSKYGIGLRLAQKIHQRYKEEAIDILEKNPYQYVFDIEEFGFKTADKIAMQNGLSLTHPSRIGAGCLYVLEESIQDGHVYLPISECTNRVLALLSSSSIDADLVAECLVGLHEESSIVIKEEYVYLPILYYAEEGFAKNVKRLVLTDIEEQTTLADLMKIIGDIEEAESLSYGKEQFDAIEQALHSKVMILTGGPGTGKTTVIKGILNAYAAIYDIPYDIDDYEDKSTYPFILTAPTGRAAKRLNESTGLPASTIHRLLGWDGHKTFVKNEYDQLSGKFLIIDEFSMVDIWLANNLFKAIPDDMQVLLVGDEDQLPSVGPGQVLSDLLTSTAIPAVTLNEVYRQKEGSKIIELAHQIKNDTCSNEQLKNEADFSFIQCNEQQMLGVIMTIFEKAIAKGVDVNRIQVLAPMYRSQAGINSINKELQQLINPASKDKRERNFKDVIYRVGDKVIQLVNQPEDGVSNGDIGEIIAIFKGSENTDNAEQLVISFEEKEVVYERNEYHNIMHAYCISIHKSQGSEFPIVLLPVLPAYNRMLRKNLLYTAITRGTESLIICGERQSFLKGIQTHDTNKRYTTLPTHLIEQEKEETIINKDEESISPYDFI